MIVSRSRRYVFVHVPKCAGESIEVACGPTLSVTDILIGARRGRRIPGMNRLKEYWTGLNKHSPAEEIREWLGSERYDGYLSFAVVRHPVDRIYSLFTYYTKLTSTSAGFRSLMAGLAFDKMDWGDVCEAFWRRTGIPAADREAYLFDERFPGRPNFLSRRPMVFAAARYALLEPDFERYLRLPGILVQPTLVSQHAHLFDSAGDRCLVSSVIKLESLKQEWPNVAERIGAPRELPHINASAGPRVPKPSESAQRLLRRHYARDMELFGYA